LISNAILETDDFSGSFFSNFDVIMLPSRQDDLLRLPCAYVNLFA